jgi:hypothetical protein
MSDIYCTGIQYSMDYGNSCRATVDFLGSDISLLMKLFSCGHVPFSAINDKQKEFKCLWCETPNPIEHVVCSRRGAPRGVLIS